jgi:hypothetical protein
MHHRALLKTAPLVFALLAAVPAFALTPTAVQREEVGNRISENIPAPRVFW